MNKNTLEEVDHCTKEDRHMLSREEDVDKHKSNI